MATLRSLADENGREPTTEEVAKLLDIPDLSASGYVAALQRAQVKALATKDVAERTGLSVRRVREMALEGLIPARHTLKGWRYTEESVQTIVTRRTLEVQG